MNLKSILFLLLVGFLFSCSQEKPEITGELKTWHKVTMTFDGPESSETAEVNPFTDYRLNVTFSQGENTFVVPGYYAADGQAAFTSADAGNKWRVHFSPNAIGEWNYKVSFKKGAGIAVSNEEGKSAKNMDGATGTFMIEKTDKTGRDLRAHGRLMVVGEHYQRFAATGKYFLKMGADAPENLLAYEDFDATPNVKNLRKSWSPHLNDYQEDANDLLWGPNKDKGKALLGAVNYLSSKGMNVFSFLTYNIDGDDHNVYPYILSGDEESYIAYAKDNKGSDATSWEDFFYHDRFDCSKMDQWERIFEYGDRKGMYLHFKTTEAENCLNMDGGSLGPIRKLYYRELIARYGHHLALNWNIGEETEQTVEQLKPIIKYIADSDPYKNQVVLHTHSKLEDHEKYYRPMLGDASALTGISLQTRLSDFSRVHGDILRWVKASAASGKKWIVACDEPGDASNALITDAEDPSHDVPRKNALWGTLMAGGAGVEWYFGYKHPDSDLTCESWRSRDLFWDQCKVAIDFFKENEIPFWEMECMDEMTESENDYVFAKTGEVYLVYAKEGGKINIELPDVGYSALFLNPLTGETIAQDGITSVETVDIDCPSSKDWLLYLYK